jgi:O-acetyl-ADP-ribose deacetylase (regulator of RNase III)
MIKYIKGDATQPQGDDNKIIIHICNDIGAWGSGFVLAVSKRWSLPEQDYRKMSNLERQLGVVKFISVEPHIVVANMIAQHDIKTINNQPPLRYSALRVCLLKVKEHAERMNASVHMPRIGCGLAGGNWDEVSIVVEQCLEGIDVTVYDFN